MRRRSNRVRRVAKGKPRSKRGSKKREMRLGNRDGFQNSERHSLPEHGVPDNKVISTRYKSAPLLLGTALAAVTVDQVLINATSAACLFGTTAIRVDQLYMLAEPYTKALVLRQKFQFEVMNTSVVPMRFGIFFSPLSNITISASELSVAATDLWSKTFDLNPAGSPGCSKKMSMMFDPAKYTGMKQYYQQDEYSSAVTIQSGVLANPSTMYYCYAYCYNISTTTAAGAGTGLVYSLTVRPVVQCYDRRTGNNFTSEWQSQQDQRSLVVSEGTSSDIDALEKALSLLKSVNK